MLLQFKKRKERGESEILGFEGAKIHQNQSTAANFINSALVFIKPHANTLLTRQLVTQALIKAGCSILSEGLINGTDIDSQKLIDRHYFSIASKATIQKHYDNLPKELKREVK